MKRLNEMRLPVFPRLRGTRTQRGAGRGPLVVTTWGKQQIDFLVVTRRGDAVRPLQRGRIEREEDREPLEQLAEHLRADDQKAQRLLVLLPRAELDMSAVEVPATDDNELPTLVQMEIDQSVGENDREVVVDFIRSAPVVVPDGDGEEGPPSVTRAIAYWMFVEDRDRLRQTAEAAGFRLEAISARQLGPLSVLESQQVLCEPLSVVIAFYTGEIEFSFFRGTQVVFLRSVRVSSQEVDALAEQIQTEIRRTASLTGFGGPGEPVDLVLLARGDVGPAGGELARELLAESLTARVIGSHGPVRSDAIDEDPVLWGAASDLLLGKLPVDMVSPKVSPVPPNPLYRRVAIAAAAVIAVAIAGYFLIADVRELERQVEERRGEVEETTRVTAKLQEKSDEARFVRQWLEDQVDWLDRLRRVSAEFPDGRTANVRRLAATATDGGGRFDLSVQVKDPEAVAGLEERLREAGFIVSSAQISEQSGGEEYPWQFDTRIGFRVTPTEEREEAESFVSKEVPE